MKIEQCSIKIIVNIIILAINYYYIIIYAATAASRHTWIASYRNDLKLGQLTF